VPGIRNKLFVSLQVRYARAGKCLDVVLTTYLRTPNRNHPRFCPFRHRHFKVGERVSGETPEILEKVLRHRTSICAVVKSCVKAYTVLVVRVGATVERKGNDRVQSTVQANTV
jgi:hypothetical protein